MEGPLTTEPADRSRPPGRTGPTPRRRDQAAISDALPHGANPRANRAAGMTLLDGPGSGASPATAPSAATIGVPSGDLATLDRGGR